MSGYYDDIYSAVESSTIYLSAHTTHDLYDIGGISFDLEGASNV